MSPFLRAFGTVSGPGIGRLASTCPLFFDQEPRA